MLGADVGRRRRPPGRCASRRRRHRRAPWSPRAVISRGRPAQPAEHPGHSRARRRSPGPAFHSARWDHDVDLAGKRVAMIGAGASGFQIAPAIADEVAHLTVFQRTAQWMFPNPNYHEPVGTGCAVGAAPPAVLRPLVPVPDLLARLRQGPRPPRSSTPTGRTSRRAVSEINDLARMMFTDWITSQVGDDPELLAKVVPDYPATGKRTLQDNGSWLRTLTRDNVELVRTPIARIERRRRRHRRRRAPPGRRDRLRHRLPGQPNAVADEGRRPQRNRPAGRGGASGPRPTSASRCRSSRTSSACTARAPTWRTAAA